MPEATELRGEAGSVSAKGSSCHTSSAQGGFRALGSACHRGKYLGRDTDRAQHSSSPSFPSTISVIQASSVPSQRQCRRPKLSSMPYTGGRSGEGWTNNKSEFKCLQAVKTWTGHSFFASIKLEEFPNYLLQSCENQRTNYSALQATLQRVTKM